MAQLSTAEKHLLNKQWGTTGKKKPKPKDKPKKGKKK